MASESTPRINCQYLEQFIGKTVRITGKVVSLRGDTGTLEAKGSVTIHLNRVGTFWMCSQQHQFEEDKADEQEHSRQNSTYEPDSHFLQDAHLALNNAAEIIGKVERDMSVRVFQSTDFGNNIGE